MNSKNSSKDPVLERIVNAVAKDMGINADMIWKVYTHFYNHIFNILTEDNLQYMSKEEKIKRSRNVLLFGFGRIVSTYGKTFRTKLNKKSTDGT